MTELNTLFRKRINIPENEKITFETLGKVLEKTAKTDNRRFKELAKQHFGIETTIDTSNS